MTADALNTDAHSAPASTDDDRERSAIAALSVEEKVLLLTGADSWRTQGAEALGLRPMITSDGPAGVRGVIKDERSPSSSLPCPTVPHPAEPCLPDPATPYRNVPRRAKPGHTLSTTAPPSPA
jgi:hypothetical protein